MGLVERATLATMSTHMENLTDAVLPFRRYRNGRQTYTYHHNDGSLTDVVVVVKGSTVTVTTQDFEGYDNE